MKHLLLVLAVSAAGCSVQHASQAPDNPDASAQAPDNPDTSTAPKTTRQPTATPAEATSSDEPVTIVLSTNDKISLGLTDHPVEQASPGAVVKLEKYCQHKDRPETCQQLIVAANPGDTQVSISGRSYSIHVHPHDANLSKHLQPIFDKLFACVHDPGFGMKYGHFRVSAVVGPDGPTDVMVAPVQHVGADVRQCVAEKLRADNALRSSQPKVVTISAMF